MPFVEVKRFYGDWKRKQPLFTHADQVLERRENPNFILKISQKTSKSSRCLKLFKNFLILTSCLNTFGAFQNKECICSSDGGKEGVKMKSHARVGFNVV